MNTRIDEGLWAWRQGENHNHMIDLQEAAQEGTLEVADEAIELAYFGGSAFRITTPAGVSVMIDPWRNPPWGNWDWYLFDFPRVEVDIAMSTHAHFDHDGIHLLSANVILDRLIGRYSFGDLTVTGIADKHVSDSSHNAYDWAELTRRLTRTRTTPPDNSRSFDNCLLLLEVAGLRILHWGDNRPNPPETVWRALGEIDILLLPVDGSQHVLSYDQADEVAERLNARMIVPHHYGIWNVTTRASTLLPADEWMKSRKNARWAGAGSVRLNPSFVREQAGLAFSFGEHVAFDVPNVRERA